MSEPEVLPHHHPGRVQPVYQHGADELIRLKLRELQRERQHTDGSHAEPGQQLCAAPGAAEQWRMRAWPNHLVWVRVKGDDHDRQPKLAGHLDSASHDPLMAAMHAVELTNGDDGPAPLGWHVIKAVPPLHVRISLAVVLGHRAVPQACHGARPADTSGPARRAGIRAAGEYGQ